MVPAVQEPSRNNNGAEWAIQVMGHSYVATTPSGRTWVLVSKGDHYQLSSGGTVCTISEQFGLYDALAQATEFIEAWST